MKSKRISWKWIVVAVGVVGVIAQGVLSEALRRIPVRTAVARVGTVEAVVEERGRTTLPEVHHITMPMNGRVLPIALREGDGVTNGQVVALLDDVDWRDAKRDVAEVIHAFKSTLDAMNAQVKSSEIRTDHTKWVLAANEKAADGGISEREVRQSRWQFLDSEVSTDAAKATLHAMEAFYTIALALPTYVQRNLTRTQVLSPVSGTVLKRHVWSEMVKASGEALLDVGDLSEMEITAEVLTDEAVAIRAGDEVVVSGDAVGGETVVGVVRRIDPMAFTKLSSLGVEQQRVAVRIGFGEGELARLRAAGLELGVEYRVRVRVITERHEGVVAVPRTALFRGSDGGWFVYVVENGVAGLTSVEVGVMNDRDVEIVRGVGAGAIVVLAPEAEVGDGVRVSVD